MPKLLIADAAQHYRNRGDYAITKHFLYDGCRSGSLPHYRVGNRYIIDTDLLDQHLETELQKSLKEVGTEQKPVQYGQLRRIGG